MTVRLKITMLITTAGFVASLVFSCIILWEMVEQPFRLIDSDLKAAGPRIARAVMAGKGDAGGDHYWLEVRNPATGEVFYRSGLARTYRIDPPSAGRGRTVSAVAGGQDAAGRDKEREKVDFRVYTAAFSRDGKQYLASAGRPVEHLEEELGDTVSGIAGGLVFSVLVLAAISYFLAGLMLRPIRELNAQARDISEKHLDRRMPVTGERDEFNTLAETLNTVFDRLQHAFLRQKRLLADASHELKTPLTMMRLALDAIRSDAGVGRPDPQAESHERMTEQVLRMDRLVKSLLDLSSLEIEAVAVREPVDLTSVLGALIEDYRFLGETRGIVLRADLPDRMEMEGDADRLTRAFSNLLDNAVKYNVDGGSVSVTGAWSSSTLTVTLANTGPGVPDEDLPRIFEQFYRVEKSRSQQYGGSGLGLAIVRRIVELHGGRATFENRPKGLTTVTVTLPRHGRGPDTPRPA